MEQNLPQEQTDIGIAKQQEGEFDAVPYMVFNTKEEYQQDFDDKMGKRLGKMRAMEQELMQVMEHFGADSIEQVLSEPSSHLVERVRRELEPVASRLQLQFENAPDARALAENTTFVQLMGMGLSPVQSFLAAFGENYVTANDRACPVEGAATDTLTHDIFSDVRFLDDDKIKSLAQLSKKGEKISF